MDKHDRDLIIRTVIGEAEAEGPLGQFSVAHSIKNRLDSGRWGKRGRDVVHAPAQYEPWGNPERRAYIEKVDPNSALYRRIGKIVDATWKGEIPDPTGGATHFQNERIVANRGNKSGMAWNEKMKANGTAITLNNHTFGNPDLKPLKNPTNPSVAALPRTTWNADEIKQASEVAGQPIQASAIKGPAIAPPVRGAGPGAAPTTITPPPPQPGGWLDAPKRLFNNLTSGILPTTAPERQGHAVVPRGEVGPGGPPGGPLPPGGPVPIPPPRPPQLDAAPPPAPAAVDPALAKDQLAKLMQTMQQVRAAPLPPSRPYGL
jgi:Cell Wall Hydrolase